MKPLTPLGMALPAPQDYLTSREVRDQFRLSIPFLSQLRCRGEGPRFTRLGIRKVLYLRSDVKAWLEAHAIETRSAS
jgi:predicted DNA-binding transcriptional regulator AlpA